MGIYMYIHEEGVCACSGEIYKMSGYTYGVNIHEKGMGIYMYVHIHMGMTIRKGCMRMWRGNKMTGLFCRILSHLWGSFAKKPTL